MKIRNTYHKFIVEIEHEDWNTYYGRIIHETIKALPSSSRKWIFDKSQWIVDNKYYTLVNSVGKDIVSYSNREMESADNEFINQFILVEGYTI